MERLRVAANTKPNLAAGAIAGIAKKENTLEVAAVGAGAVNQAVKAIAIAGDFIKENEWVLACKPSFEVMKTGSRETTIIKFLIEVYK